MGDEMGAGASSKSKPIGAPAPTPEPLRVAATARAGADMVSQASDKPDFARQQSRKAWAEVTEKVESQAISSPDLKLSTGATGYCLAADVGGTNSRFMVYSVDVTEVIHLRQEAPGKLLFVKKYANIRYASFADVMQAFFDDCEAEGVVDGGLSPEVACLAVAGVAQQNICRLTNLDWIIDGPKLSKRFGIPVVEVINDFVAQGYGVLTLGDHEVIQLAGPEPCVGAPIACVGAGTGLGQCFLVAGPTGEYQAFPSEGGHCEFAPRGAGNDETQMELLRYLKVKFSGWNRISYERVVSGKGICNVYEFLAYSRPKDIEKPVHEAFMKSHQDAGIVAKNAKPGTLCYEALRIFAECYGAVCGTFSLQVMPFGGFYLSGGVTQKLQEFLVNEGSFLEAYFDKGRVSPMLEDVPLFFVKGDEMGQRGAHLRSVRLLHHRRRGLMIPVSTVDADKVHLAPPRDAQLAEMLQGLSRENHQLRTSQVLPAVGHHEEGVTHTEVAPIKPSDH